jgi:hypothetical protein
VNALITDIDKHQTTEPKDAKPQFFVVWIDCNCGFYDYPDWEMNSPPKLLPGALDEAAEARLAGFPTKVMLEGKTPRSDGLFSNPASEP